MNQELLTRLRALATTYKTLVLLVGAEWLMAGIRNQPHDHEIEAALQLTMLLGIVVAACALAVYGYRLARLLELSVPILWGIALFVPVLNLIALLVLSRKSQAVCRAHGIRVGFFGPNLEDVSRLERDIRAGSVLTPAFVVQGSTGQRDDKP